MTTNKTTLLALLFMAIIGTSLSACQKQGPLQRAGEEVDEAVSTAKNGGKETPATKVDDAVDELRDGVKDAKKDLKK